MKLAVPWTSSVYCGVVVPMPTLVLAPALLIPAMLPSTRALLSLTCACAPMAVALVRLGEFWSGPAWMPRAVLRFPVLFQ